MAAILGTIVLIGIRLSSASNQAAISYIFFKPIFVATMGFKFSAILFKRANPQNSLTPLDIKIASILTLLLILELSILLFILLI